MHKIKKYLKDNWIILLGVVLTILYLYSKVIFGEYEFNFNNVMYAFSPWNSSGVGISGPLLSDISDNLLASIYKIFYSNSGFSFWNSFIALGTSEDLSIIMYPLNYIYILPFGIAILLKSMLKFVIGFIGMYLLMRQFGLKKITSVISGVTYTFSSALVMWHGWPHTDVAVFAPFTFLLVDKLIKEVKIKYALILTVVLYIMLSAGMPTYVAYFMYLLGIYLVVKTIKNHWNDKKNILIIFFSFGIAVIIAVGIASPYLIDLLSSVGSNGYSESRAWQASSVLKLEYIRTLIFPYIRDGLSLHMNECTIYSGIFALYLGLFTFVRFKEKKNNKFWIISGIVLLLLVFTHSFDFIYTRMPAINTSFKYRIIVLFNFVTSIIMGYNLDDMLTNKEYYKKRIIYFFIAFLSILAFVGCFVYSLRGLKDNTEFSYTVVKVCTLLFAMFLMTVASVRFKNKIYPLLLCIVVIFDMTSFAKNYFPLVSDKGQTIPKATSTIQYLQENTTEGERITAIGQWTLFCNTNIYYGLHDIRAHNFVNTNEDMKNYYSEIDKNMFVSNTRTGMLDIDNVNLLKYMGVKYIASVSDGKIVDVSEENKELQPIEEVCKDNIVEQQFYSTRDRLNKIQLLVATYGKTLSKDENMICQLYDEQTGEEIYSASIPLSELEDNQYLTVEFPVIEDSSDKKYKIRISSTAAKDNSFTIWSTVDKYDGDLLIDGVKQERRLSLRAIYSYPDMKLSYVGNDNLNVFELNDYSDRVQLIDNVVVEENSDSILDSMKDKYIDNTLFITEDEYKKIKNVNNNLNELKDNESVDIITDEENYIKLKVNVNEGRFLLLNDYYTKDWKVYIDGKEGTIQKGNYLMRTIYIENDGNHIVEFKYEPKNTYIAIYISIASLFLLFIIFGFNKKIQSLLEKNRIEINCKERV